MRFKVVAELTVQGLKYFRRDPGALMELGEARQGRSGSVALRRREGADTPWRQKGVWRRPEGRPAWGRGSSDSLGEQ